MVIIVLSVKKSKLKRIAVIIITILFAFSAVSMVATKLVYDNIFDRYESTTEVPAALSSMVDQRQVHKYPSGENTLTGYYYPGTQPESHGLIILIPGFHAGGDSYLWQIQSLQDYGWAVFTFDTTGSFRSEGEDQVGFSQATLDLEATLKYVEKNNNFGYNNLALIGHSRGGYAACCALALEHDIAAVVSVSGVNSAMEGVMQMSCNTIGPVAYCNYGFLWLYQVMLFGDDTLDQQACEAISRSDTPVLVVHGTQDEDIPLDSASVISHQEEITSGNVEYLLRQAGHTDLLYDADGTANDELMYEIHAFLIRSLEK